MTLNYNHIASVADMSDQELQTLASAVLTALRDIPPISDDRRDGAGIAIRGGSVFSDALDYRHNALALACARRVLMNTAQRVVIDCIECAPFASAAVEAYPNSIAD